MIIAKELTKRFDKLDALAGISCEIPKGCIFGLVGSNGAGKSTFLRMLAGVYKPDGGSVKLNGNEIYNSPTALSEIVYVSDELYFLPGANICRMAELYKSVRGNIDATRLGELAALLKLETKRPISQFSKGMKRQTATILALACKPKLLLLDETFDGLDPVMRRVVKKIIVEDVLDRGASVVISSHSLRELEDTCDQLALLHKGGLVLQSDISELKTNLFKLQIALNGELDKEIIQKASGCELLCYKKQGSVASVILKGSREQAKEGLEALKPLILDLLPLTLEEIFVYEMDTLGYNFDEVLEGGREASDYEK